MKNIDKELVEWAVNKIQTEYKEDVSLLIGQVGGGKIPTDEQNMVFDFFVPATERGNQLARTFIIEDMGYDLYPISWERLEGIANIEEPGMIFAFAKGEVIYAISREEKMRFESLKKEMLLKLQDRKFQMPKSLEFIETAQEIFQTMIFEESLCNVRKASSGVCSYLMNAIAIINGTYLKNGYMNFTNDLSKMKDYPHEFEETFNEMLSENQIDAIKHKVYELIRMTRKFLMDRITPDGDKDFEPNYEDLAMWYQEMRYTFRRIAYFTGINCIEDSYLLGCYLQIEFDAVQDDFKLKKMDLLSFFDKDDLSRLAKSATEKCYNLLKLRMKNVFEMDYDIERILSALKVECGKKIEAKHTLLIFDEIQEVPKALNALKYFYENAQEYAIVAAGSLLGIALHEGTSFPVGKVDFLTLYPLNFTEFLLAAGQEQLVELAEKKDYELINAFADKYTDLLRKYYYVGGMPEVVSAYLETDDLQEVRSIQHQLLLYYANDSSKHAPKETVPRIQMVWNSIPMQLSKENRKFIYGMVREGGRAKDFELAIQWLLDCGLVHKSYRIRKPGMPLISYMDMPSFKIYMSDVGLLGARCNLDAITLLEGNEIFKEFKGALTEQFVAQELVSSGIELYYYSADNSSGEVDFVLQRGNKVIPVEVKAEENLQAKSLRALCKKYELSDAVRSSMSNYREQEWMVNVPLYLLRMYL